MANNNMDLTDLLVGQVLEVDRLTRRLAVYIPKLMPALPASDAYLSDVPTSFGATVEGTEFNQTVKVRNTMWVEPWNYHFPLPDVGSKVIVYFIDGNPKSAYWVTFNPNNDLKIIEEERYPLLANLKINNKTIVINTEDTISINLPSDFYPVYSEDNKNKTVEIVRPVTYHISEEEPATPIEGAMWFNSATKETRIYRDGQFVKVIFETDLQDIYKELESLTRTFSGFVQRSRLLFVSDLLNIRAPENRDIVVVDSTREGYQSVATVESSAGWTPKTLADGLYYLLYTNEVREVRSGIEKLLNAFIYRSATSSWEKLDGWFAADLTIENFDLVDNDEGIELIQLEDGYLYRISEIELINPLLSSSGKIAFYDDNDVRIGLEFSLSAQNELTVTINGAESTIFTASSVLIENGTVKVYVPDVILAGVIVSGGLYVTSEGVGTIEAINIKTHRKEVD